MSLRSGTWLNTPAMVALRTSNPCPVRAETGTIGAPASAVPSSASDTSACTSASQSGSFRIMSTLVSATTPALTCNRSRIARCSPRLRHHALVGGDDKQGCVDASHTGQHILDKVNMARHVDHAHRLAVRQGQPGKAEVDSHLARLFLGQPVGIDTRQGEHES